MAGLKRLVSRQFDIEATISKTRANVVKEGKARRQQPIYPAPRPEPPAGTPEKGRKTVTLPARIVTIAELDALIQTLSDLRWELHDNEFDLITGGD